MAARFQMRGSRQRDGDASGVREAWGRAEGLSAGQSTLQTPESLCSRPQVQPRPGMGRRAKSWKCNHFF